MSVTKDNHQRLMRLFRRDGEKCFWCDHSLKTQRQLAKMRRKDKDTSRYRMATIDHIKPRNQGGTSHLYNLVAACSVCNVERSKSNNAIDLAIAEGKYELPERPKPYVPSVNVRNARHQAKRKIKPVIPELDQTFYVEHIPWRVGERPVEQGLYLVTNPDRFRVLLVPLIEIESEIKIVQRGEARRLPGSWWWCPLRDILSWREQANLFEGGQG